MGPLAIPIPLCTIELYFRLGTPTYVPLEARSSVIKCSEYKDVGDVCARAPALVTGVLVSNVMCRIYSFMFNSLIACSFHKCSGK
jgi:hypothetical protein